MDPKVKDVLRGKKLILVSNREPYTHEKTRAGLICGRSRGGLVSALDPVMQACGGTWVAWGSTAADFEVVDARDRVRVPPEDPKYTLKRIRLSEEEVSDYYRGFSNQTLWPLFHLFTGKTRFDLQYWETYRKVNEKFAASVLQETKLADLVWVHDYHLSLVPRLIRKAREEAKVAFFWHIPWIPWEVFRSLPWRRAILEGLLGSDLIGFHTGPYAVNFMECVRKELGFPVKREKGMIKLPKRRIKVRAFPVGIEYDRFASPSKNVIEKSDKLRQALRTKHVLLSIDRLDYTKGILRRLEAFERFLEKYPHFRGDVVLMLIATPSRIKVGEYREMKRELDRNVGRINGRFQRVDWIPVRYFYRTLPQDELITYYRAADVALITPLMDGMNLMSKEYVATREGCVLILSEFAGAAEQLKEAILVNPYDREKVADSIRSALEMSSEERKRRSQSLRAGVEKFDIYWWLEKFFEEWKKQYR